MDKYKGFTLIELMVVVAIIAIFTMITVPCLTSFLAKAKRTEAYMNLGSIYTAEKAYWAEHGNYTTTLSGEGGVGWQPEGYSGGGRRERFYYTYGFGQGAEGRNYFTGKLGTSHAELSGSCAGSNTFKAFAAGDIDGDGKADILSVNQFNDIKVEQDDLA